MQCCSGKDLELLRLARSVLTDRIMAVRSKEDERKNAKINARTSLYDKVLLTVGFSSEKTYEQLRGPLSVIENTIDGGLRYLNLTGLEVKACDLERGYFRTACR